MFLIIHRNEKIQRVINAKGSQRIEFQEGNGVKLLQELSKKFPHDIIGWCEEDLVPALAIENWEAIFHHDLIMASYSISGKYKIESGIGYVENSPFLKFNLDKSYPTWLMSTNVGGISAKVLNRIDPEFFKIQDLSFFLNTIAKLGQVNHLFCYSAPGLIDRYLISHKIPLETSTRYLFKFVKQNYRLRWSIILFFSFLIFEKKFYLIPLITGVRKYSNKVLKFNLDSLQIQSTKIKESNKTLDVIIPTLGRRDCLYEVLKDLSRQTQTPSRIIIVEQNPDLNSATELNYIYEEEWPFEVVHHFTHDLGACKARNWALNNLKSKWVFFSDDDIRLQSDFIERAFKKISEYGVDCGTFSCVKEFGGGLINEKINQSTVFGSGNSFVKAKYLRDIRFSRELEFGYGEDMDFGIQLRNAGVDVIHFPFPQIRHIKASVGGFRTKFTTAWEEEGVKVQPAPTVLWIKNKHFTREQFFGYKMFYFISQIKNGNYDLLALERRWCQSLRYSQQL